MLNIAKIVLGPVLLTQGRYVRRTALKEQRKASKFTQADLALRAGIAKSFVSRMERGCACPTIDTVFRIANAFDVQPEALVKRLRLIYDELDGRQ